MRSSSLGQTRRPACRLARAAMVAAAGAMLGACVADGRSAAPSTPPPAVETAAVADEGATISGSARIDRLIETYATENGVPPALAFAVIRVESRYNPKAKGRGVYGLSQIMPATARSLGFSGSASDLYDPETNLKYGMKYLAGAWEKGGHDVCRASMKYKAGHRATHMSRSTLAYCSAVKRHMAEVKRRRMPEALRAGAEAMTEEGGARLAVLAPQTVAKPAADAAEPKSGAAAAASLPGVAAAATVTEAASAAPAAAEPASGATTGQAASGKGKTTDNAGAKDGEAVADGTAKAAVGEAQIDGGTE